jgi:hypothetical protein
VAAAATGTIVAAGTATATYSAIEVGDVTRRRSTQIRRADAGIASEASSAQAHRQILFPRAPSAALARAHNKRQRPALREEFMR